MSTAAATYTMRDFIFEADNFEISRENFDYVKESYQANLFAMYIESAEVKAIYESMDMLSEGFEFLTESVEDGVSIELIEEKFSDKLKDLWERAKNLFIKIGNAIMSGLRRIGDLFSADASKEQMKTLKSYYADLKTVPTDIKITEKTTSNMRSLTQFMYGSSDTKANTLSIAKKMMKFGYLVAPATIRKVGGNIGGEGISGGPMVALQCANAILNEEKLVVRAHYNTDDIRDIYGEAVEILDSLNKAKGKIKGGKYKDIGVMKSKAADIKRRLDSLVEVGNNEEKRPIYTLDRDKVNSTISELNKILGKLKSVSPSDNAVRNADGKAVDAIVKDVGQDDAKVENAMEFANVQNMSWALAGGLMKAVSLTLSDLQNMISARKLAVSILTDVQKAIVATGKVEKKVKKLTGDDDE